MESLFDTFDFPRSSTDATAPPDSDCSKTSPSNSTLFRFGGTHWQCAHCLESVLYSLANGHVEHVRMWKCCQCGFSENRVSLLAACSMCDYTNYRKDYACQYPSDKVLEAAAEGAETDSAAYKPSDVIRVEAPGTSPGRHASNDFLSTVQRNLPSLGPFFNGRGRERLEDVLVVGGSDDTSMLISIDDVEDTGFGADRTELVYVSHANLPTPYGIDEPATAYSRGDVNSTATISSGDSSSTSSVPTKTSLTPSTITAVTRQDLDSGYGSQSNIFNVDKASRKRANEADHQISLKSDTINNNTSSTPCKKPRRRRCDTINPGLACPFYVRSPNCCEHDSCVGPGFLGIHRLKQHLERVHLYYTCERCGAAFQGNATGRQDLATHQRNTQPCELVEKPSPKISSLSHVTFEVMRSKKGAAGKSEEERWREIYRLIFEDADEKDLRRPYVGTRSAVQRYPDYDDRPTQGEELYNASRQLLRILPERLDATIKSRLHDDRLAAVWREFADDQLHDLIETTLADLSSPGHTLPPVQTTIDRERACDKTDDLSWFDLVDYNKL